MTTDIALYEPEAGTKAVDIRRQMVTIPSVLDALNAEDKAIFIASTKTPIRDIDDEQLIPTMRMVFKFIALDVGYRIQDKTEWAYVQTRLLDHIKKHYSDLSVEDVREAFDLLVSGSLNGYLPKDSQGNPDGKHYQSFNVEYFSRILNAYIKKRDEVEDKAQMALPEPPVKEETPEQMEAIEYEALCREFKKYRATRKFNLNPIDRIFIWNWFVKKGYIKGLEVSEADRKKALQDYLDRASLGLVNKYDAHHVIQEGTKSSRLDFDAKLNAKDVKIKEIFDSKIK